MDSGLSARQRDFRSEILRLAWPAIVENLLHTMVGIVDTAMVGRLGAGALAAVGLGNQVNQLGLTVFSALATGSTALVARHVGAGEQDRARAVARSLLIQRRFSRGGWKLIKV
ncbi:MAG: MATE family efflux transporter [Limnochordia bacterium]